MRPFRRLLAVPVLLIAIVAAALPSTSPAAQRVTGGVKASPEIYQSHLTSLVALIDLSASNQYDGQFCAGTLIDEQHVLTAGHCIVEDGDLRTRSAPSSIGVLAGTAVLDEGSLNRSAITGVQSIFVNPNFNIRTMRWDAAILRLATPITTIAPIARLSDAEVAALGMGSQQVMGRVAGWGDTNPYVDGCCYPTELKTVEVPIHASTTCETNLANAPGIVFDTTSEFCAGRLGTGGRLGADTCQGDSGGPLYVDVNGTPRHAGVTSFGVGCGQRYLGVYARTTALAPWLDSIPGIPAGDARSIANGPGDLAAPTVTARPLDYRHARLTITPAATGAAPTAYTVWAREGAAAKAKDIYRGKTSALTYDVLLPAIRTTTNFNVLVRPWTATGGDGVSASVRTRPLVDTIRPTTPRGLRVTRSGTTITATWGASIDRQSLVYGYWVQRQVSGSWRTPKLVRGRSLRVRAGAGRVRVMAEDYAGNRSGWSASVAH